MRPSLIALAATTVLAIAACSGTTATTAPATAAPATAAPATAAPATAAPATAAPATAAPATAGAAGPKVAIKNFSFNPATIDAKVGESITWTNGDDAPHTVTFDDSSVGGSGNLNNGSNYELAISKAGTYAYKCKIHPSMTGTVKVS